jgi:hypothetical protein
MHSQTRVVDSVHESVQHCIATVDLVMQASVRMADAGLQFGVPASSMSEITSQTTPSAVLDQCVQHLVSSSDFGMQMHPSVVETGVQSCINSPQVLHCQSQTALVPTADGCVQHMTDGNDALSQTSVVTCEAGFQFVTPGPVLSHMPSQTTLVPTADGCVQHMTDENDAISQTSVVTCEAGFQFVTPGPVLSHMPSQTTLVPTADGYVQHDIMLCSDAISQTSVVTSDACCHVAFEGPSVSHVNAQTDADSYPEVADFCVQVSLTPADVPHFDFNGSIGTPLHIVTHPLAVFDSVSDAHESSFNGRESLSSLQTPSSPESIISERSDISERSSPNLKAGLEFFRTRQRELSANRDRLLTILNSTLKENEAMKHTIADLRNALHESKERIALVEASEGISAALSASEMGRGVPSNPLVGIADTSATIHQLQHSITAMQADLSARNEELLEAERLQKRLREREDVFVRENQMLRDRVDKLEGEKSRELQRIIELQKQVASNISKVDALTTRLEHVTMDRENILSRSRSAESDMESLKRRLSQAESERQHLMDHVERLEKHARQQHALKAELTSVAYSDKRVQRFQEMHDEIKLLRDQKDTLERELKDYQKRRTNFDMVEKENAPVSAQLGKIQPAAFARYPSSTDQKVVTVRPPVPVTKQPLTRK